MKTASLPRAPRVRDLENRFAAVTQDRLRRAFDTLSPRQQDVVEVIPLLFHLNHPLLPGYCGPETPYGIADYSVPRAAVAAARRFVKTFSLDSRALRVHAIRGIYLMGSAGTVAYSRDSDLDIWLCHASELDAQQIALLKRKAASIEAFALTHGVEIHFYVFDPERFRRGETLRLSAESSGSSQHYLLLDEFYRSGLLLAGLKPLWWFVPPEVEANYDQFVAEAIHQRRISARHYVDFGGVPQIPPAEFFGAALWQLYKSIDSPYKSVMKLLLMESYAADYPDIRLLSHRYKHTLNAANLALDDLDPYLAMFRRVEEYLMARHDTDRLRLLRRAFYLKTNESLSAPADPRQPSWRREILQQLVAAWGWSTHEIVALDHRPTWRLEAAREERRELVKALQKSYLVLAEFARRHGDEHHITASDLNVLGRKLYAAFERKPHKLELITRGICQHPVEPVLTLMQLSADEGDGWALFEGRVEIGQEARAKLMRKGESMVELVAWCHFNRLNDTQTEWQLFRNGERQALSQLRKLQEAFMETFPTRQSSEVTVEALARPPRTGAALFFFNTEHTATPLKLADGDVLTTSHTDAFRFGGSQVNLLESVDLVYETTWGEFFSYRYRGRDALPRALCEAYERGAAHLPIAPALYCFAHDYGHLIKQRAQAYVEEIGRFLCAPGLKRNVHHIVAIDDSYLELASRDGRWLHKLHTNALSLFKSLGSASTVFRDVHFDANCADNLPLAAIYRHNRQQVVQAFAYQHGLKVDLYVLDERGDLYVERQIEQSIAISFDHLARFLASLKLSAPAPTALTNERFTIEWYHLQSITGSRWQVVRAQTPVPSPSAYVALRVFADVNDAGDSHFTCYCEEREFSSRDLGSGLFNALARFLLANRHAQTRYPAYITEFTMSEQFANRHAGNGGTAHLLELKKRFEYHLTKAVRSTPLTD